MRIRPKGKYLIKQELKNKGIEASVAEKMVEEAEIDELDAAKKLLMKKWLKRRK